MMSCIGGSGNGSNLARNEKWMSNNKQNMNHSMNDMSVVEAEKI